MTTLEAILLAITLYQAAKLKKRQLSELAPFIPGIGPIVSLAIEMGLLTHRKFFKP